MTTTATGASVPQQRISPDDRTRLENLHGSLTHEVNEHEAAGRTEDAALARARVWKVAQQLGWSE